MTRPSILRRIGLALGYVLLFSGCDGNDKNTGTGPEQDPKGGLVGVWLTRGEDPELGQVNVAMTLFSDGRLAIVQELPAGARLSFSGTWTLEGFELALIGAYFIPDGQRRVRCQLTDQGLELEDMNGNRQIWRRGES